MYRIAIVGATGAVGQEFCALLRSRKFPVRELRLLASARSAGKQVDALDGPATVVELTPDSFADIDIAFFSAGAGISREFVPHAVQAGAVVIDNSSAFRMDPEIPLVVPEINLAAVRDHHRIIANPNCSTIILAVVLWPLHRAHRIRRVVVSTYQAVSGAGARALEELETQTRAVLAGDTPTPGVFTEPCAFNVFSHDSAIGDDGLNVEERKLVLETRKIFCDDNLLVAPTCLRVAVRRAHTESATIEFHETFPENDARETLRDAPGVEILDERETNRFPTPLRASNCDDVLVGRIRQDATIPDNRGLQLLCSGDQLRKGAALNAIQIAEGLHGD